MNIILFGSPLNPLSATAASFFHAANALRLVVLPQQTNANPGGGFLFFLSKAVVGLLRLKDILLRRLRLRKSTTFSSLNEFLAAYPDVPQNRVSRAIDLADILETQQARRPNEPFCVICCIFPYKIKGLPHNVPCINVHPGLLPENRGPNPYFWALALNHSKAGLTYHILSEAFDSGSILRRIEFPVPRPASECTLEKLTNAALRQSLPTFMREFEVLFASRQEQGEGHYYPSPSLQDRNAHKLPLFFSMK